MSEYLVVLQTNEPGPGLKDQANAIVIPVMSPQFGDLQIKITAATPDSARPQSTQRMQVEVRGRASDLDTAVGGFWGIGADIATQLAVVVNAYIPALTVWLAYEPVAPGNCSRDFAQYCYPTSEQMFVSRFIPGNFALDFFSRLSANPYENELRRAILEYNDALQHIDIGRKSLTLAHLYMGFEAITDPAVHKYCTSKGIRESDLPTHFNIREPNKSRAKNMARNALRREVLFQGDADCFEKAKKARNEIAHGNPTTYHYEATSRGIHQNAALYLRTAILRLCGFSDPEINALYKVCGRPIGNLAGLKMARGKLEGTPASQQDVSPAFKWHTLSHDGSLDLSTELLGQFGDGIVFSGWVSLGYACGLGPWNMGRPKSCVGYEVEVSHVAEDFLEGHWIRANVFGVSGQPSDPSELQWDLVVRRIPDGS